MSILKLKLAFAVTLASISFAPATFAADMVMAPPRVASYKASAPACHRGCKQTRVCDNLTVNHGDRSKVVAVCYKAKY